MANNWYVNSAATGTAVGTSWANACTGMTGLLGLGTPPAAGDSIFVANTSAETYGAAASFTFAGTNAAPIWIYSTTTSDQPPSPADLKPGASIITTGAHAITLIGTIYVYGLTLAVGTGASSTNANLVLANSTATSQVFDTCLLQLNTTGASAIMNIGIAGSTVTWNNTVLSFASVGHKVTCGGLTWKNTVGGLTGTIPTTLFQPSGNIFISGILSIEGVDLSAAGSGKTIVSTAVNNALLPVILKDCKLGASVTVAATPTNAGGEVYNIRSDSSATDYRFEKYSIFGTSVVSTTVVRTGGAITGATPNSQTVTTSANASPQFPFVFPSIGVYNSVTGTTQTVTCYGLWNSASLPNNNQFWIEVEYMGSSATPLGSFVSTGLLTNLTTATALTADSTSVWNSAATPRANSQAYSVGNIISVNVAGGGGIFFCTASSGNSASSPPAGYATAVDGGSVTDGSCTFRAATRFSTTATLSSPAPGLIGGLTVRAKAGAASSTFYFDPVPIL